MRILWIYPTESIDGKNYEQPQWVVVYLIIQSLYERLLDFNIALVSFPTKFGKHEKQEYYEMVALRWSMYIIV